MIRLDSRSPRGVRPALWLMIFILLPVGVGVALARAEQRPGRPGAIEPTRTVTMSPISVSVGPDGVEVALPSPASTQGPSGPTASPTSQAPVQQPSSPPVPSEPSELRAWIRALPEAQLVELISTGELDRHMAAAFPRTNDAKTYEAEMEGYREFLDEINARILAAREAR